MNQTGQNIKQSGFTGTISTNKRMNGAFSHIERNVIHRLHMTKSFRNITNLNSIFRNRAWTCRSMRIASLAFLQGIQYYVRGNIEIALFTREGFNLPNKEANNTFRKQGCYNKGDCTVCEQPIINIFCKQNVRNQIKNQN